MTTSNIAMSMAYKFRDAEKQISYEEGDFYLFGLFEREQVPGRWDLVASAPWLKTDREGTHHLIVTLRDKMDIEDWSLIGAVVPLEPSAFFVQGVTNQLYLEHGVEEINDFNPLNQGTIGIRIGHAFLITSNPSPSPARMTAEPVAA